MGVPTLWAAAAGPLVLARIVLAWIVLGEAEETAPLAAAVVLPAEPVVALLKFAVVVGVVMPVAVAWASFAEVELVEFVEVSEMEGAGVVVSPAVLVLVGVVREEASVMAVGEEWLVVVVLVVVAWVTIVVVEQVGVWAILVVVVQAVELGEARA